MLSLRTIEPHTLELLKALMQEPALCELRLVGGTALALQYGHRSSIDLDLFGKIDIDAINIKQVWCIEDRERNNDYSSVLY